MTRCKLMVILKGKLYSSVEFNGNGDWNSLGKDIYKKLKHVQTLNEFKKYLSKFNKQNFNYPNGNEIFELDDKAFDLNNNTTDYLYVKNLDNVPRSFIGHNTSISLDPYEFHTMYFDDSYNKSKFNKIEFEKKYEEDNE